MIPLIYHTTPAWEFSQSFSSINSSNNKRWTITREPGCLKGHYDWFSIKHQIRLVIEICQSVTSTNNSELNTHFKQIRIHSPLVVEHAATIFEKNKNFSLWLAPNTLTYLNIFGKRNRRMKGTRYGTNLNPVFMPTLKLQNF